ncbi:MAG: hypothetical protein ACI8RA_001736 [Chlamydiales bacterium]|jgi:hypothetical protein
MSSLSLSSLSPFRSHEHSYSSVKRSESPVFQFPVIVHTFGMAYDDSNEATDISSHFEEISREVYETFNTPSPSLAHKIKVFCGFLNDKSEIVNTIATEKLGISNRNAKAKQAQLRSDELLENVLDDSMSLMLLASSDIILLQEALSSNDTTQRLNACHVLTESGLTITETINALHPYLPSLELIVPGISLAASFLSGSSVFSGLLDISKNKLDLEIRLEEMQIKASHMTGLEKSFADLKILSLSTQIKKYNEKISEKTSYLARDVLEGSQISLNIAILCKVSALSAVAATVGVVAPAVAASLIAAYMGVKIYKNPKKYRYKAIKTLKSFQVHFREKKLSKLEARFDSITTGRPPEEFLPQRVHSWSSKERRNANNKIYRISFTNPLEMEGELEKISTRGDMLKQEIIGCLQTIDEAYQELEKERIVKEFGISQTHFDEIENQLIVKLEALHDCIENTNLCFVEKGDLDNENEEFLRFLMKMGVESLEENLQDIARSILFSSDKLPVNQHYLRKRSQSNSF